jgi:glutamine amidotransferase
MSDVVIVDFGMGNLRSVERRLRAAGATPRVTSDPEAVAAAVKLVLPGVGHFAEAMRRLEASGLRAALAVAVERRRVPVLGICLGMQLLARHSEEGEADGLGWLDADVVRFRVRDTLRFKVPHMGWNQVSLRKESRLTDGVADDAEFYFVHSYHLVCRDPRDVLGETLYDYPFPSAVAHDNVYGVQFHPEKSHDAGRALLANFVAL